MIQKRVLHHSIVNINLHKIHKVYFALALTICDILILLTFLPLKFRSLSVVEKRDLGHWIANINLHKIYMDNFCASTYSLQDINIVNF